MSVKPRIHLYLVHQETGQRYPVGEEVVIGRSSGDILFTDDIKMSSQHCRIVRTPQGGVGIHDLGSSNGTYVDGIRLNPDKVYVFKPDSALTAGQQVFKLQQPKLSHRPPRRKKRKKKQGWDLLSVLASILAIGSILFFAHLLMNNNTKKKPAFVGKIISPFELVEIEMEAAFNEYAEMGKAHTAKELSDKGLANGIRKHLVPRLNAAYEKLGVLKPANEYEKRKIDVNRKLIKALIEQVGAMASYADTKSPKFAKEVERLSAIAAAANKEAQELDNTRSPTNYDY